VNAEALAAAQADWQARGRAWVAGVLDADACAAARAAVDRDPVASVVSPGAWVWFVSSEVDPALLARVVEVARAVVGLDVTVGQASVRRFPRGAWADLDPRDVGFVGFALDLSTTGLVGGARRFPGEAWPATVGGLGLWWEDGVTPVAVDLVRAGERVELTGVLGAAG
jgi:hypothetical protein